MLGIAGKENKVEGAGGGGKPQDCARANTEGGRMGCITENIKDMKVIEVDDMLLKAKKNYICEERRWSVHIPSEFPHVQILLG